MSQNDIIGLIVVSGVGLLLVILSFILLSGRGAFFIAGYNTMSRREKEKYNVKALCRFMGLILLPVGLATPLVALGGIYSIPWLTWGYVALTLALAVFAVIYANTGNRFKK